MDEKVLAEPGAKSSDFDPFLVPLFSGFTFFGIYRYILAMLSQEACKTEESESFKFNFPSKIHWYMTYYQKSPT